MANKLALGLVIGGAVSSTVGAAFKDVSSKVKKLEEQGSKARVLEKSIAETMRLRDEWRKAHMAGEKGADGLRRKLENNLDGLRRNGVEVRNLAKAYGAMGREAAKAELKAKGYMQLDAGKQKLKNSIGQAAAATAAMAIPTKVSADYGAIIRDIAIKANIADTPEEAQMSKTIIGTSRDTGMARNQVAEVVNALVGAGMALDKAMSYAPVAAKFAIGQGSDGGETARMINALGQNAKISDPAVMQRALEAIAYQGQAGSFEAADMARWFPELLAGMGKIGITGMDAVTQLGSMLQVQMKTAGGADEAANNLKNWMEKIGSGDTVKAYKDAGIDYQGSMNTGLQSGKSTLESSFELAQKYIAATDPKKAAAMAAATAKISKEADPEKAKAMIASLEQALRTGDLFSDMQVKGALTAYMQNKGLYDQLKKDSADATGILDKNLAERRQASAQKWSEMAQGMDDAMRAIGDAFRPVTDKVADGLTYVTQGLAKLSDESPRVVSGIGAAVAAVIAFQTAMSGFKIAKGLVNLSRGTLMGNPNIPQKVIVTNMPVGGSGAGGIGDLDDTGAGDGKDKKGKRKGASSGEARGSRTPGRGSVMAGVKGPAVLALIEAGFKAKGTYDNAETQDEKAEGYGAAAGTFAGTLAGAAAGAAIGSAVPIIGTVLGGLIGGYLGSMGGDALGGALGKSMFGADESLKVMPVAGPLMMRDAGKDIPPVMGDIAKSFAPQPTAPLMLAKPGQWVPPAAPVISGHGVPSRPAMLPLSAPSGSPAMPVPVGPGDAARSMMLPIPAHSQPPAVPGAGGAGNAARLMMMPQASADMAAGPLAAAVVGKIQPSKIETKVEINSPIQVTVQGDVKDPAELMAQLRPLMEQQQRDIAQQLESRKLYDAPNI